MSSLANAEWFEIPRKLFEDTHRVLRQIGDYHVEGLLLWVGTVDRECARVSEVVVPEQYAVQGDDGISVIVDGAELHRIGVWLYQHRLVLLGQVHSHPAEAYHSALDNGIPIATTQGSLSLVVPDFGTGPADPTSYAAYRLDANGEWLEVSALQLPTLLRVT